MSCKLEKNGKLENKWFSLLGSLHGYWFKTAPSLAFLYFFFRVFVLIKSIDFVRLQKLELTICIKAFTCTPFNTCVRKRTLKCLLSSLNQWLLNFKFYLMAQHTQKNILPFFVNSFNIFNVHYAATWILFMKNLCRDTSNFLTTFKLILTSGKILFGEDSYLSLRFCESLLLLAIYL